MTIATAYVPASLAADGPTNEELAQLVQQQADQIAQLKKRLDAVEAERPERAKPRSDRRLADSRVRSADTPGRVKPVDEVSRQDQIQPGAQEATAPGLANQAPSTDRVAALEEKVRAMQNSGVKVDWSSGAPEFTSPDGQFVFGIGGRIQYDGSTTDGSRFTGHNSDLNSRNISGSEFRRVRLDVEGQLTDPILYKLEVELAGGSIGLRDTYLATQKRFELGQGVIYLGKKFADSGLDGRTSSKWTWFTDRNVVANDIDSVPGSYNVGLTGVFYGNHDDHISFAVSKGSSNESQVASNNLLVRSRAHWNPVHTDNAIVHLGANGYYKDFDGEREPRFTDRAVIAGAFNDNLRVVGPFVDAEDSTSWGLELAGLYGPFAAGAEYGSMDVNSRSSGDARLEAYSGQIGWTVIGEKFGYSTKQGVWTLPPIEHPVTDGGAGVWQLVARYGAISSSHDRFGGGDGHGATFGIDWYLNRFARLIVADTIWQTDNQRSNFGDPANGYYGHDDGNTVNARAQVVF
tara:strand:- start:4746 stop:6299 length:1554 start_codon:yes stop_codon:yes gene_type:complete